MKTTKELWKDYEKPWKNYKVSENHLKIFQNSTNFELMSFSLPTALAEKMWKSQNV